METVVLYAESILTVLVALIVYLYLTVSVLPRLVLRPVRKAAGGGRAPIGDRGLRRVTFPEGRAVVYRPSPASCRYLRYYALIRRDGCTYIKCRIHPQVAHIRYDVAAFDRNGRLLDVLSVSERISEQGCTRMVRLPRATAYACVTLRKADGVYVGGEITVGYSLVSMGIYAALCGVTAAVFGAVMQGTLAETIPTLPGWGEVSGTGATVLLSALAGILCAAGILTMYYFHTKRVMNK